MSLLKLSAYKNLKKHLVFLSDTNIKELFKNDKNRFENFSVNFEDQIMFDYSKNLIDKKGMEYLTKLADQAHLKSKIKKMFDGSKINTTEDRAVLHTALRNLDENAVIKVDGKDILKDVRKQLDKTKYISEKVRSGDWVGYTGKRILDVVCIGIGGSYLGAQTVIESLDKYASPLLNVHFISNIDGTDTVTTLQHLNPETTLFIVISKTFTTDEVMTNMNTAKAWLLRDLKDEKAVADHFVAVSTNKKQVKASGILEENMLEFWDFVGGRFSLWSTAGALPISIAIGFDNFEKLLEGGYKADTHFKETEFEKNIPVLMSLISIWYRNFIGTTSEAIIPYDSYMKSFALYEQQTQLESNGKYLSNSAEKLDYGTAPVLFGDVGTCSQHSFFQMIHQGTDIIPVDFIYPAVSQNEIMDGKHHKKLLSNAIAQAEALMSGKTETEVLKDLKEKKLDTKTIKAQRKFKVFEGNRPSNTFLLRKITPETFGMMLAFYEHKVFVNGVIWDVNSFDQFGVELGKELAKKVEEDLLSEDKNVHKHDGSTDGLLGTVKRMRKEELV